MSPTTKQARPDPESHAANGAPPAETNGPPAPSTSDLLSSWIATGKAHDDANTALANRLRSLGASTTTPVWIGDDGYKVSKSNRITKVLKVMADS